MYPEINYYSTNCKISLFFCLSFFWLQSTFLGPQHCCRFIRSFWTIFRNCSSYCSCEKDFPWFINSSVSDSHHFTIRTMESSIKLFGLNPYDKFVKSLILEHYVYSSASKTSFYAKPVCLHLLCFAVESLQHSRG